MKKKRDYKRVMVLLCFITTLLFAGNALAVTVSSKNLTDGATGVAIDGPITVTFSADMDPATLTTDTFVITTLIEGCVPDINSGTDCLNYIPGTVTTSGTTASFKSTANLAPNTLHFAMLRACFGNDPTDPFKPSVCIKDASGNRLDLGLENDDYKWSFTTGTEPVMTCDTGDFNCDKTVDLTDAIIGLQICAGMNPTPVYYVGPDVNADLKIGLEDILYVLRVVVGVTP